MNTKENFDILFEENNIYVCEWMVVDCEVEVDGDKSQILSTFDYTYHPEFFAAKYASSLELMGYALAKELIQNSENEIPSSIKDKNIFCHNVWVYKEGLLVGKFLYSENRKSWYPFNFKEEWREDFPDLITIPLPKD